MTDQRLDLFGRVCTDFPRCWSHKSEFLHLYKTTVNLLWASGSSPELQPPSWSGGKGGDEAASGSRGAIALTDQSKCQCKALNKGRLKSWKNRRCVSCNRSCGLRRCVRSLFRKWCLEGCQKILVGDDCEDRAWLVRLLGLLTHCILQPLSGKTATLPTDGAVGGR